MPARFVQHTCSIESAHTQNIPGNDLVAVPEGWARLDFLGVQHEICPRCLPEILTLIGMKLEQRQALPGKAPIQIPGRAS